MKTQSTLVLCALTIGLAACGFGDGPSLLGDGEADSSGAVEPYQDPVNPGETDLSAFGETAGGDDTVGADAQSLAWVEITWPGAQGAAAVNMDLHVINALGEELFYLNTGSSENGSFAPHDECVSFDCSGDEQAPRETIVWQIGDLVPGHYQAWVENASDHAGTVQIEIVAGDHRINESVSLEGGSNSALYEWDVATPVDAKVPADASTPSDSSSEPAAYSVEMTWVTANIGRTYPNRAAVRAVFDKVGDATKNKTGPKFIGWQEISEADPCGKACEIEELRNRFDGRWDTYRPRGARPDGGTEAVKVPITSRGANKDVRKRARFASPGWAGVSPTRFVTTTYHPSRNVSIVNTHLIAGAWSCKSHVDKRRDYWRRGWRVLKAEVARQRDKGRNVIVTGDLNRPRAANGCNPKWDPTTLNPAARIVGGTGIDYIFAVPARGHRFKLSRREDGTVKRGSIGLGIDSHKAHWVTGKFKKK